MATLIKKLGINEGDKICVVNEPKNYDALTSTLPAGVIKSSHLSKGVDLIHLFTETRAELNIEIRKYIEYIKPNGMIWISWPKKSSNVDTDVTENSIRDIALPLGLVDIKVCAVDETWSGLKLVIRKENR